MTISRGERFHGVRGVLALGVVLGAARLPGRGAEAGLALAARVAPAEVPEVHVPHQRPRPATGARRGRVRSGI